MSRHGKVLAAAGLDVVDKPRAGRPGAWAGPNVRGILLHHTAGAYPGDLKVVTYGRSDLPGPLSQFYLEPDGTWHVISEGRCNHAGGGSYNADGLVIPTNLGNELLLGVEVSSLGREPISGKQYTAMVQGVAALCRLYNFAHTDVIRHADYTSRKIDIRNNLADVQTDIKHAMKRPDTDGAISSFPLPPAHVFGRRASADYKWVCLGRIHNGSTDFGGSTIDSRFVRQIQKRLGLPQTGWFGWKEHQATLIKQAWWRTKGHTAIRVNGMWDQATWDAAFPPVG